MSGAGLAAWLQTPWILSLFAALLAVLALAMFDVFTPDASGIQARLSERSSRIPGGRYTGALLMGALSALIVGPAWPRRWRRAAVHLADRRRGAGRFRPVRDGLGHGRAAADRGRLVGALLPKAGPWMDGVKRLFGMLLLATAWWMLIPVVPTWVQMTGWAFLAIVAAVMLRAFDALPAGARAACSARAWACCWRWPRRPGWSAPRAARRAAAAGPSGCWGGGAATPGAASAGEAHFKRVRTIAELDAALAQSRQPVMLDFYADWCVSCREMERFTFTDPGVAQRMGQMLLLQADVTANNADDRALLKRFRLFGPPGIMFFEPGGKELPDARVVGFQDAKRFTESLDRVLTR